RRHREVEGVVPVSASIEAEHHEGAAADSEGSLARLPGGAISRRLHPHIPTRRDLTARDTARGRSPRRRIVNCGFARSHEDGEDHEKVFCPKIASCSSCPFVAS